MGTTLALKALVVWLGILLLAIANGVLREVLLMPTVGMAAGLVLSGLLLSSLIIGLAWFSLPWLGIHQRVAHVGVGIGWLVLTLLFEISFGLWQGKSWSTLLGAYTFKGGNIWPFVLVVTVFAPSVGAMLRGWGGRR